MFEKIHILRSHDLTPPYQKSRAVAKTQQLNCIISVTSDWIFMIFGLLDLLYQDASNHSIFISLALIDKKLFLKNSKQ